MKRLDKKSKGFTLVELLVVIAIIGILAVIAVPALFSNINKSKIADLEGDYSSVKSATMGYYAEHGEFPTSLRGDSGGKNLSKFMEEVPEKSSIGGGYKLNIPTTSGLTKVCVLTIDPPVQLTSQQIDKLIQDIGQDRVYKGELNSMTKLKNTDKIESATKIHLVIASDKEL